jgi:hypothetical protein
MHGHVGLLKNGVINTYGTALVMRAHIPKQAACQGVRFRWQFPAYRSNQYAERFYPHCPTCKGCAMFFELCLRCEARAWCMRRFKAVLSRGVTLFGAEKAAKFLATKRITSYKMSQFHAPPVGLMNRPGFIPAYPVRSNHCL